MKFLIVCALALATTTYALETKSKAKVPSGGRAVSVNNARDGQFPYQVALNMDLGASKYELCGGSLIDKQWIITAAHCTIDAVSATVYLGTIGRASGGVNQKVSRSNFFIHPNYSIYSRSNDISLIKIQPVAFNAKIQPINLPPTSCSNYGYIGDKVVASGWGRLAPNSNAASNSLRFISGQVISNDLCKKDMPLYAGAQSICINNYGAGCVGDTGGPLVAENSRVLVGIASYSEDCNKNKPVLFTGVCNYLQWIKSKTGITSSASNAKVNTTVVNQVCG